MQLIYYGFPEVSITKTLLLLRTEKTHFSLSVLISFDFFEKIVHNSDRLGEEAYRRRGVVKYFGGYSSAFIQQILIVRFCRRLPLPHATLPLIGDITITINKIRIHRNINNSIKFWESYYLNWKIKAPPSLNTHIRFIMTRYLAKVIYIVHI